MSGSEYFWENFFLKKKAHYQIIFFVLAGAVSAVIEVISFKIFSSVLPGLTSWEEDFMGVHFPLSNILSSILGIVSNYYLSIWFVFTSGKHSKRKEFSLFLALSVGTMLMSLALFQFFYNFVHPESMDFKLFAFSKEILSKISAIAVTAIINFIIKKRIIFHS